MPNLKIIRTGLQISIKNPYCKVQVNAGLMIYGFCMSVQ